MELNLQMARGGWRSRAALISAPLPVPRAFIEPFPSKGLAIAGARRRRRRASRLTPVEDAAPALAAVQERSVPRPRCATRLRGEDA